MRSTMCLGALRGGFGQPLALNRGVRQGSVAVSADRLSSHRQRRAQQLIAASFCPSRRLCHWRIGGAA